MTETVKCFNEIFENDIIKLVISQPTDKDSEYKKITVSRMPKFYQIAKFTQKQVFHENIAFDKIASRCAELSDGFQQIFARSQNKEIHIKISPKGKFSIKEKTLPGERSECKIEHNRQKKYLLAEGETIAPLVDMGIFTKDGKVVNSMYDKYKQINRFIEIIDDSIRQQNLKKLNIIDFGCGKSYLTFIVYYYLTHIKKIDTTIIGLDLKKDVIEKCNRAAEKYGYSNLHFELGDINGYTCPFDVDMVITLHACDTATDFALFNAINWDAKMIFSVPCCQHELNKQMKAENLSIFNRYGIIQERFAALLTDSIRGNILEYCGYKTQIMEFIDLAHTPKNILIRAVKKQNENKKSKEIALNEIETSIKEFNVSPTLYNLIFKE